jgi:hypothetical protein
MAYKYIWHKNQQSNYDTIGTRWEENDIILLAKQSGSGYNFSHIPVAEKALLLKDIEEDRFFYEQIPHGQPVKLYVDLDWNTSSVDIDILHPFFEFYQGCVKKYLGVDVSIEDFCILQSPIPGKKVSYHLVLKSKFYFECNEKQAIFMKFVRNEFLELPEEHILKTLIPNEGETRKKFIDLTVYSNKRNFRLVNQSKREKRNPLVLAQGAIAESFCRLYADDDMSQFQAVEPPDVPVLLNPKAKKQTSVKKTSSKASWDPISLFQKDMKRPSLRKAFGLKDEDIDKIEDEASRYLHLIPVQDSYVTWLSILWAFKASSTLPSKEAKALIMKFCALNTAKYNKKEDEEYFTTYVPKPDGYKIELLRKLATTASPAFFQRPKAEFKEIFECDTTGCTIYEEQGLYMTSDVMPANLDPLVCAKRSELGLHPTDESQDIIRACRSFKFVGLFGGMGCGKTTATERFFDDIFEPHIKQRFNEDNDIRHRMGSDTLKLDDEYRRYFFDNGLSPISVLCLSPRVSLSDSLKSTFSKYNPKMYLDFKGLSEECIVKCKFLFISPESIWRVGDMKFDVVFIDEIRANVEQISSDTMKGKTKKHYKIIRQILTSAKHICFADAFLNTDCLDFIRSIIPKVKDVPECKKYFKMLRYGVPKEAVLARMTGLPYLILHGDYICATVSEPTNCYEGEVINIGKTPVIKTHRTTVLTTLISENEGMMDMMVRRDTKHHLVHIIEDVYLPNQICILRNHTQPKRKNAVEMRKDDLKKKIMEDLKEGKNVVISSATKGDVDDMESLVKDALKKEKMPINFKAVFHSRDQAGAERREVLGNIREEWRVNLVVYSPSITVGNNFDVKEHFDYKVLFAYPSTVARNLFQMIERVRHTKEDIVYFSINKRRKLYFDETFTVLEKYRSFLSEKRQCIRDAVLYEIEALKLNVDVDPNNQCVIFKLASMLRKLKTNEVGDDYIGLDDVIFKTMLEKHVSDTHFVEILIEFFRRLNYNVMLLDEEERERFEKKEEGEECDCLCKFDAIRHIKQDELKLLGQNIEASKDEPGDKLEVEKFYYLNNIASDHHNDPRVAKLFFNVYRKSNPKKVFENVLAEHKSSFVIQLQTAFVASEGQVSRYDMKAFQLRYILHLNQLLGLAHSQDTNTVVDKVHFDEGCKYVLDHYKDIRNAFMGLDAPDQSKDTTKDKTNKDASNLITTMYECWSGMTFSNIKTKETNKTKSNKHSLAPMGNMIVFKDLLKAPAPPEKEKEVKILTEAPPKTTIQKKSVRQFFQPVANTPPKSFHNFFEPTRTFCVSVHY